MLRWQTIDMLVFLMLAGSALTSANVWAQETTPRTGMPQSQTGVDQEKSDPPAAASEMVDITGTWQVESIEPDNNENAFFTWEIRRVQQGEIDFLIDMPWVKEPLRLPVKWSAVRQRFEGEYKDDESDTENYRFTLQPQPDGNSLLVIHNPMKESDEYVTQMWTRVSKTLATTYPPNGLQQPESPPTESRAENLVEGADRPAGGTAMTGVALQPSAIPNTPTAKDLLKRLETQESAAATAANEIRRLQANGDAAETIAPHQAQMKAHLQTAFELKMQLEELQVKELQTRLSRLERQIGQRKELRDKIIERRAAELLNLDVSWETTTQKSSVAVSSVAGATDQQQSGMTVTLPLIVGRYSEELLQSQVGFSGISLYAENVQATTHDGKPVRATVVLAHNCRLDSFEPIPGSNGQLWAATFHVLQGEQADGSHQELTQKKVTQLADAGAIFVLDHLRSDDGNHMRPDADNSLGMSAAVPNVLQIRLRCARRMSINKGLVGADVVFADNGQTAIMSVYPGRQMEFSFVEGAEKSRGPFLLSFQYNGTDTTATTWLANNVLPIEFLAGDQDRAISGQLVEKAVYLDSASGAVKTISSHTIEPGVDPVNVAATKGIVIGVVRISKGIFRPLVDETSNAGSTQKNQESPNTSSTEPRSTSSELNVPALNPVEIDQQAVDKNIQKPLPISQEQKLRWRSGIVEIFALDKPAQNAESIGRGVLISSSGLILSQISDPPRNSKFLAKLDDGNLLPLEVVEFPGSKLYVFQLPPNTPINHHFKLSEDQLTPSGEVYVFGSNMSSPEHQLELFTAQVAMKNRQVTRWELIQLQFWQLSKPDNYGSTESWPALNAKGELLGITLRDTGNLLLVLPVEELKKVFPKTLGKILNSSSVDRQSPGVEAADSINPPRREAPSASVIDATPTGEIPALLQELQGKWIIEKSVSGLGEDPAVEQIAKSGEVVVDGSLFTIPFTEGDKRADVSMLIEIQSPGNPQGVKVTFDPNGVAATALGIIDCGSDQLRLCIGQVVGKGETLDESSRPKVFAPGSDVTYLECQRKPTELPKSPIGSRSPNSPDAGIEAIAAGLDTSTAAIKNISVTTDYKKRHVYGLPFDAPIELTFVTKTIIDNEGRLRVETTGQQINIEPDGKSARAYNGRWETVFQKGEARSLTWYESNPPTASIDNFPSLHGIHPQEFTTHFQSKPASEIIRTSAAEVTERVMWDDRPVTIVQTTPNQNANDARRYRFWIDQERNAVVRRAISIRYAEGQPWQEYARIENHDYQEIAPGIWLPGKVKYESLEVTPELTPAKLSWSFEGTNHDWMVNRELPADTFELAFPEGTFVNDHRTPGR